jgi:hypothetical protein
VLARFSTAGLFAAALLALPADRAAPSYTLESTGAIAVSSSGSAASFGRLPPSPGTRPALSITLGAPTGETVLALYTYADMPLTPGRYPVAMSLPDDPAAERRFHPCFIVGTTERPRGFFHGVAGWVTVTEVGPGWIAGAFEIEGRGFLAQNDSDDNLPVTIRGRFGAQADSTIALAEVGADSTQS